MIFTNASLSDILLSDIACPVGIWHTLNLWFPLSKTLALSSAKAFLVFSIMAIWQNFLLTDYNQPGKELLNVWCLPSPQEVKSIQYLFGLLALSRVMLICCWFVSRTSVGVAFWNKPIWLGGTRHLFSFPLLGAEHLMSVAFFSCENYELPYTEQDKLGFISSFPSSTISGSSISPIATSLITCCF